ncbi:hypothetical protein B484DRAFT_392819 [Ochromonadaceae sp. CCMP2298]|nr:hypothetical protein B484DRAFT_392819 [Ochromonadaceae sp. CCMP2298]
MILSPEWDSLSGGEIYDRFIEKGAKLGTQANKMLRETQKHAHFTASVGLLLGKSREEKVKQRVLFANLSTPGLHFLRVQMKQLSRPPGDGDEEDGDEGPGLDPEDMPANIRARASHLADDPASTNILELIFGGVTKKARREMLDDKSTRNKDLWKLRALFSALRTQYTIFNSKYYLSGQIEEGNGAGDDDFCDNFARGDIVYMYMHILYAGQPPRFCIRDLYVGQKRDCQPSNGTSPLGTKGAKLGTQANKMLRETQKHAHFTASVGLLLGKSREEKVKQRVLFANLSTPGLHFLRVQMKQLSRPPASHLADDPASTNILELIFGGVTKKARRETLDDKSTRNKDLWKVLCDDFFNNPN